MSDKHDKWLRVFSKEWQPNPQPQLPSRFTPSHEGAMSALAQLDPIKVSYTTDDLRKLLTRLGVTMHNLEHRPCWVIPRGATIIDGAFPTYEEAVLPQTVDPHKALKTPFDVLLVLDQLGVHVPRASLTKARSRSLPLEPTEAKDGEWHSIFSKKWQPKRKPSSSSAAKMSTALLGIKLESLAESDILGLLREWGVIGKSV